MIKVTLCLALFLLASSQGASMTPFVQVKGYGTYYQPPTVATVCFQIKTQAVDPLKAITSLMSIQSSVASILMKAPLSVPNSSIVYSNLMVYPIYVGRNTIFVGSEDLRVNVSCTNFSMHMAAMVIDGLANVSGVAFMQVTFNSVFDDMSEDMARKNAYMSAMYKAKDYAQAARKNNPPFTVNLMSYPMSLTECDREKMMSLFSYSMPSLMKGMGKKDSFSHSMMSSKPIQYILTRCVMAKIQFTN